MSKRKQWTTEDFGIIESELYTVKELAEHFGVPVINVRAVIVRNNLKYKKIYRTWKKSEIDFIRDNTPRLTNKVLGKKFGVSESTINSLKRSHDIKKFKRRNITDEDIEFIKNNLNLSDREIGKALGGFTNQCIYVNRKKHNIKREW